MTKFPDNARLGLTLYLKSPSLGEIKSVDVAVSPDDDGEVEVLSEGIAELTRRWCAALNRTRKVTDFRPATRNEVVAHIRRHGSVDQGRAAAKPPRRPASAPRAALASSVRYRLLELSSRYLAIPRRALAALRSQPWSWSPERRRGYSVPLSRGT
jgi:hypothetical protein